MPINFFVVVWNDSELSRAVRDDVDFPQPHVTSNKRRKIDPNSSTFLLNCWANGYSNAWSALRSYWTRSTRFRNAMHALTPSFKTCTAMIPPNDLRECDASVCQLVAHSHAWHQGMIHQRPHWCYTCLSSTSTAPQDHALRYGNTTTLGGYLPKSTNSPRDIFIDESLKWQMFWQWAPHHFKTLWLMGILLCHRHRVLWGGLRSCTKLHIAALWAERAIREATWGFVKGELIAAGPSWPCQAKTSWCWALSPSGR